MKKIFKNISIFVLSFVFGMFLARVAKAQNDGSLLYKIEKEGVETSYLFGTIHVMPNSDFKLKDKVKNALLETDQVVMELDMDDPSLQMKMMKEMSMKDGLTLDKVFSKEDYEKVDKELKTTLGMGIAAFNTFKPFFIYSFLLTKYLGEQPASFETALTTLAQEKEINIEGLETVEFQMSVFDKIPYEQQAEDVMEMIDEEEKTRKMFKKMIELYKSENVEEIFEFTEDYFDHEGEMETLLTERNKNWIPLFAEFADDTSTFFAVGAAHLGGEEGVLALLKKAGYTVEPVSD